MARNRKRKEREREEEAGFGEAPVAAREDERTRLMPVDIQEKVFRLAFRGYSERDVDEFLDKITEDLAALHEENKRLREQLAEGGGVPGGLEEAQRQAEGIVRQAREHAARLVEDAEAQPAAGASIPASAGLSTSFLLQERRFLQQMAGLIQDHARRLKEEARQARSASSEPSQDEPAAPVAVSPPPPPPRQDPSAPASGTEGVPSVGASGPTVEPQPEHEPDQPSAALQAPEESTAPWAQPTDQPGEGEDQDRDPLLSAWESAFTAERGAEPPGAKAARYPSEVRSRKDDEGEPSLRELFWGDEG